MAGKGKKSENEGDSTPRFEAFPFQAKRRKAEEKFASTTPKGNSCAIIAHINYKAFDNRL